MHIPDDLICWGSRYPQLFKHLSRNQVPKHVDYIAAVSILVKQRYNHQYTALASCFVEVELASYFQIPKIKTEVIIYSNYTIKNNLTSNQSVE